MQCRPEVTHPNEPADERRSLLVAHYVVDGEYFEWTDGAAGSTRRLWLLNRLDSATSGVILTAASEKLALAVRDHYAKQQVRKAYQALVFGRPRKNFELWLDQLAVQKKGGQIRTATVGNVPALVTCWSVSVVELPKLHHTSPAGVTAEPK